MRSCFTLIPVLHPLPEDYPGIILAIAKRVASELSVDEEDPRVQQSGRLFYEKGANRRHIRSALSNAMLRYCELTADTILTPPMISQI